LFNLGVYLGVHFPIPNFEPENGHALAVDIKRFAAERDIRDASLLDPEPTHAADPAIVLIDRAPCRMRRPVGCSW
jgi:hypothetical protein